jgi:hypothetical protein
MLADRALVAAAVESMIVIGKAAPAILNTALLTVATA